MVRARAHHLPRARAVRAPRRGLTACLPRGAPLALPPAAPYDIVAAAAQVHDHHLPLSLHYQPVDEIRAYFGDDIGFFFAWLGKYTEALFLCSLFGLVTMVAQVAVYGSVDKNPLTVRQPPPTVLVQSASSCCVHLVCLHTACYMLPATHLPALPRPPLRLPVCLPACYSMRERDGPPSPPARPPLHHDDHRAMHDSVSVHPSQVAYSIYVGLWSVAFIETWERREHELRFVWGAENLRSIQVRAVQCVLATSRSSTRDWLGRTATLRGEWRAGRGLGVAPAPPRPREPQRLHSQQVNTRARASCCSPVAPLRVQEPLPQFKGKLEVNMETGKEDVVYKSKCKRALRSAQNYCLILLLMGITCVSTRQHTFERI